MAQPCFDLQMGSSSASWAPLGGALFWSRGGPLPHLGSSASTPSLHLQFPSLPSLSFSVCECVLPSFCVGVLKWMSF
ncbi:hypothetical protein PRUPE_8G206200 [Prunus persica]|uniref:Uncharacterized protein n=1 Tax=Prunus persica TaxID=3760 RepID=A0A251N0V6_PRUPE|nr:hypothetical protein PRUPE_8G206200 [Prunus persica]